MEGHIEICHGIWGFTEPTSTHDHFIRVTAVQKRVCWAALKFHSISIMVIAAIIITSHFRLYKHSFRGLLNHSVTWTCLSSDPLSSYFAQMYQKIHSAVFDMLLHTI